MATTDTRSGFRLPWSSDRSHDSQPADQVEAAVEAPADAQPPSIEWPSTDFNARLGLHSQPRAADPSDTADPSPDEEPEMSNTDPAPPPAPAAPRKPSKLMADLSAAIRATAETARDQALTQVDADVAAVVEQIRAGSKHGEVALRARSDEDVAGIKEWSRAEIARIKEEAESRIAARKLGLDEELAAHAAAIEQRVDKVEGTAAGYRAEMLAYADRLLSEDDPARLATMAETMPEPPPLDALADLADLALDLAEATLEAEPFADAHAEPAWAEAEPVESVGSVEDVEDEPGAADPVEAAARAEDAGAEDAGAEAENAAWGSGTSAWAERDGAWFGAPDAEPVADAAEAAVAVADVPELEDDGSGEYTATDDVPRWAAGSTPDGFPAGDAEGGDPVDRGAIMAALEAAAEAVVAAESAAESADQAEAAADVAETAAELLKGRVDADEDDDPEATAALSARVDAGGFEESYTDRLASLLPGHGESVADGEPRATQVVVSGLVSVASIASFKRHLGRVSGVTAVAVASGPDGEFVFNVTHRPDVSFRDAVPTMPGFAARVTGTSDGVVHVSARDPESEG